MGLGSAIGDALAERHTKNRMDDIQTHLQSEGLDESEVEELQPYIDVIAQYGGTISSIGVYISGALTAVVFFGSIWLLVFFSSPDPDTNTGATFFGVLLLLIALVLAYSTRKSYRIVNQAGELQTAIVNNPSELSEDKIEERYPAVASKAG